MMTRRLCRLVLASVLVIAGATAALAQGNVLRRGISGEPGTLDPQLINGVWEHVVVEDLFLGLTTDDAHADTIPGLAKSWTISPDKTRYTLTLRTDVKWTDGHPVTAQDAVFGLQRAVDPNTASPNASLLYVIKNAAAINAGKMSPDKLAVSAPDDHTVVIDLVSPTPYFIDLLSHPVTYPIPKHVVEKYGKDWIKADHIVTDGPYKFAEWVPQSYIRAVRNPDFYDAKSVSIDEVDYYTTEDRSAALRRFRAGELDINNDVPIDQIAWLKTNMPDELRIAPYLGTYYYVFNMSKPPFNDKRVRVALSMLVDRETITDRILRTGDQPAYGVVPPGTANYDGPVRASFAMLDPAERLTRAKQLLMDAGFGPDHPLHVTLRYNTSENHKKIATAIAAMWRRAGVQTELVNSDVAVHYAALREGDFEIARAGWIADYNDAQNFLILFSDKTWAINYSRYDNPIFDRYMNEAAQTTDVKERAALLRKAEITAIEDAPILPIYFYVSKNLVSKSVKGWIDNPEDVHPTRFLSLQR